jgi:rubredoxin
MRNLYETKEGSLVSVMNNKDANKVHVMSSSGNVSTVKQSSLKEAKIDLVPTAHYDEKFIQIVVGGVSRKPYYVTAKEKIYPGRKFSAIVTPIDAHTVQFIRYASGVPAEAWMGKDLPKDHTNDGKQERFDTVVPGAQPLGGKAPQSAGSASTGGDLITIDDEVGTVSKLVLEWNQPMEISIEQIDEYFETSDLLPQPDGIRMTTAEGTVVKKRNKQTTSSSDTTTTKTGAYGLSPMMFHSCPKCESLTILEVDRKTGLETNKCPVCGNTYVYEGSRNDGESGVAGQSKGDEAPEKTNGNK